MQFIFYRATFSALAFIPLCCLGLEWNTYKGMEYALVTTKMTWIEAQRYCSNFGGVLAQPETADINNYLKSLTDKTTWLWIGASNLPDKTWEWHNPIKPIKFSDWQSTQPSHPNSEHCMVYWKSNEGFKWGDLHCTSKRGFLCQRTKLSEKDSSCSEKKPVGQKCMTICL
ncbi:C-type lectin BML-1-like [Mytilus edulis]|uniref:C-type lectin BML-1-like n=1 Tax=Mytilus edulis TaxID=6550 RepID=UPI0039EDE9C4